MMQLKFNTLSVQTTEIGTRNIYFLQEMQIALPILPFRQNLLTDRLIPWNSATPQSLHYLFDRQSPGLRNSRDQKLRQ